VVVVGAHAGFWIVQVTDAEGLSLVFVESGRSWQNLMHLARTRKAAK
jgi:hypothetical protein